jgi:hypothetical protein
MNESGILFLIGGALTLGFLSLIIWWGIRHEQRKAELIHTERMIALERGIPLPDAEIARCRALGWIGVVVPVVSLGVAIGATALLVPPRISSPSLGGLIAVWSASAAAAVAAVIAAIVRLRSPASGSKVVRTVANAPVDVVPTPAE